jgi:uncharacterized cupredoxin-like copper-binding protein
VSPSRVVGALARVTVAALLLVACGDDATEDSAARGAERAPTSAGTGLIIEAHDIKFDRDAYRSAAGRVEVEYVQEGTLPHSLVIERSDGGDVHGFRLEVGDVDADSGTVDLPPGDYVFYCDVPGHRDAGMEAEVQVG